MNFNIENKIKDLNKFFILNNKLIFVFSYLYSFFSILVYYFGVGINFSFFRVAKMTPFSTFGDLRSLTFSSGCGKDINLLRSTLENCDPYNRPFNYPRLILDIFRGLDIDKYNTELIGLIFGLSSILGITIFSFKYIKDSNLKFICSSIFLLSLPVQLVIERGNYDSLILNLFLLIPLFFNPLFNGKIIYSFFGISISFLIIKLKIFPIAGLFIWSSYLLFINKFQKYKILSASIIIYIIAIFSTIFFNSLSLILTNTDNPEGWYSFGLLTLYQNENTFMMSYLYLLIKLFLIIFTCFNSFNSLKRKVLTTEKSQLIQYSYFILCSGQVLALYFFFNSYDYRLIFSLGIIPFLVNNWHSFPKKIGFLNLNFLPYMVIFIFYQQYLPYSFNLEKVSSYLSDIIIQPIVVGLLLGFILSLSIKNLKFNYLSQ